MRCSRGALDVDVGDESVELVSGAEVPRSVRGEARGRAASEMLDAGVQSGPQARREVGEPARQNGLGRGYRG